jgi:hypothetical protein
MSIRALHHIRSTFVALAIIGSAAAHAQEIVADSSAVDSVRSRIIPGLGELTGLNGRTIAQRDRWLWRPVRSIAQVIDDQAGQYVRFVGESGADVSRSWLGGSSAHDRWSLDGLPTDDPLTGKTLLTMVPLEQQEAIEELSHEEAVLNGHRWNLVTRQFSTVRPLTAIRFLQEPDETILSDGFFTQNVARSTSLTLGFQRHTSAGRFTNAALDAWNLRTRVRANLSERLNISAFWQYERFSRGVNGGVEPAFSPSVFDEVSAIVVHTLAYEIRERTDLGLMGAARWIGDSSDVTRIGLLSRRSEREYRQLPDVNSATTLRQFARARDLVVTAEQKFSFPFLTATAAARLGSTHLDSTEVLSERDIPYQRLSVGMAVTLVDWLTPRIAIARVEEDADDALETAGSVTLAPTAGLRATLGTMRRPIYPTPQERFWTDSTVLRPAALRRGEERLVTAEVSWSMDSTVELRATGFRREQEDVVIARPARTAYGTPSIALTNWSPTWTGVTASARLAFYGFDLSGSFTWVSVEVADTLRQILPQWWGSAELAYQGRLFDDQLGLRSGVRTRFSDRLRGLSPDPPTGLDVANTTLQIGRAATVDVYGTMEIGQAFVTLSWENLTNAATLRTAVYPMPDRQFKLGVRWVFLD